MATVVAVVAVEPPTDSALVVPCRLVGPPEGVGHSDGISTGGAEIALGPGANPCENELFGCNSSAWWWGGVTSSGHRGSSRLLPSSFTLCFRSVCSASSRAPTKSLTSRCPQKTIARGAVQAAIRNLSVLFARYRYAVGGGMHHSFAVCMKPCLSFAHANTAVCASGNVASMAC